MITDPGNSIILNDVLHQFLAALQKDYSRLEEIAKGLFYYLAGLQIAISAIWMMFKNDPLEAAVKTIQLFFTIAVFYTLVLFGGTWMPQLIDGFISIGSSASGISSLTPSSVMDQGVSIGFAIMDNFSDWGWVTHPFGSLLACVLLIAIIVLYALLAAEMAIILVKSYVLVTLSGLMFAFGANEAVRPIAMNYFKAVIGIGLQLMTFYLIMGVGINIGHGWADIIHQAAQTHDLKPFLIVMAAVIVFYMIVKNVPSFIAGLTGIAGFRNYGDAAVGSVLTAGGIGASMMQNARSAIGAAGGAVQAGGQLARGMHQVGAVGHQHYQSTPGGASGLVKAAGKTTVTTGASLLGALKDSIMKDQPDMSFGQKFNSRMSQKRAQHAAKNSNPGSNFPSNQVKK